jgi:hypothetical protein
MKVTITHEHTVGHHYDKIKNCPLFHAATEAGLSVRGVGGGHITLTDGSMMYFDGAVWNFVAYLKLCKADAKPITITLTKPTQNGNGRKTEDAVAQTE